MSPKQLFVRNFAAWRYHDACSDARGLNSDEVHQTRVCGWPRIASGRLESMHLPICEAPQPAQPTGVVVAIFGTAMLQITAKIQQREVANAQLKLTYQHAMEEEQTEYVERLKSLQDQVWI